MPEKPTAPAGSIAILDKSTPGELIAAFIDEIKASPGCPGRAAELLPLLSERHAVYRDRPAAEIVRIRGYAMAAFAQSALPDRALPYVLESLESEFHPYLVAAAAQALRGMKTPHPAIGAYLIKAIYNIWKADKPVSFASYHVEWPRKEFSTGLAEIFKTLASFGASARQVLPDLERLNQSSGADLSDKARAALAAAIDAIRVDPGEAPADCCGLPQLLRQTGEAGEATLPARVPRGLLIQDQDGTQLEWGDFFYQKPSVLAFFYTRCGNPRKCTQTVFNLARIRAELEGEGLARKVRIAAMTYDPQFDSPEALKSFGKARKFHFDEDSRMLRVPGNFQQVVQAFGLGVNFSGTQVNSHRIEFYLLDQSGKVAASFLRIQTEPEQVVKAIRSLLSPREDKSRDRFQALSSLVLGVLVAFFPKCPVCWVSYLSVLGIAGTGSIPYSPWLLPVMVILLAVNLCFLQRRATRNGRGPFLLSLAGSILLFLSAPPFGLPRWLMPPGFGLMLAGALLQALSYPALNKARWFFHELKYRCSRKELVMTKR